MEFDRQQQQAIALQQGHYLVLAPPGCGKTELLTRRIIHAHHDHGVPYDRMLCLTFTNRAARGMRERIATTLGENPEGLFVGNVHRFCLRLLTENHLVPRTAAIIDELDQRDILDGFGFTKYNDTRTYRNDTIQLTDVVRLASLSFQAENRHPSDILLDAPFFRSDTARRKAEQLAEQYHSYKKEINLMDFDDILLRAYSALSGDRRGTLNYASFPWIQVDEVQDLSALQLAIVDLVTARENPTVIYLGDDQQAIYSFMGAKLGNLQELARRAGPERTLRLYTNYRSPQYLVDTLNTYATQLLELQPEALPKAVGQQAPEKGMMNIFAYDDEGAQLRGAADIALRVTGRFPDERLAILTRTNRAADEASAELTRRGVGHFRLSGQDPFKGDDFKALLAHFNVIQNDTALFDWARLLYKAGATHSFKDARDLCSLMRKAGMTPSDFLRFEGETGYLGEFLSLYGEGEMVIFDTETTGLDVMQDDIIQIAAIKVRRGEIVPGSEFNAVIRTEREIPAMLGQEPNPMVEVYEKARTEGALLPAGEALRAFLDYVGGRPVLGHNVRFDCRILRQNLLRRLDGTRLEEHVGPVWDSLKLSRLLEPRLRTYKLRSLLETFGLEGQNSHRADDDILATKSLVDHCARQARERMPVQEALWRDVNFREAKERLREKYGPLWREGMAALESDEKLCSAPECVRLMEQTYGKMLDAGVLGQIPEADHLFRFLHASVSPVGEGERDTTESPAEKLPLAEQLSLHLGDFRTYNLSDLCDSGVIPHKVFVMTVHKAKGLEFEHVMLPDAVDGTYPLFLNKREDEIKEDARLFYVGLSRSRKRLSILCPKSYRGYPKTITPFLSCIEQRFQKYKPAQQTVNPACPSPEEHRNALKERDEANFRRMLDALGKTTGSGTKLSK